MTVNTIKLFHSPRPGERWPVEVAVIGSGPGGAVTACTLAETGRDVLLIEEGPYLAPDACEPFSLSEMYRKYRNGGLTAAFGGGKVAYVEGRCVGGGSEINSGIYHRVPASVLETWRREFAVEGLEEGDLLPHYQACEEVVCVSLVPGGRASLASRKLHEGATKLGWKSLEAPRCFQYQTNVTTAIPGGRKQSMTRTYIPRALRAGCRLLAETRIRTLQRRGKKWEISGLHRPAIGPAYPVTIEAETVFIACGAIQTPALLRRSGLSRLAGRTLQLHPTIKVVAAFDEEVNDDAMRVPVHQVKEFAPELSFGCSISTPPHLALSLLEHPTALMDLDHARTAVYYAMISGDGSGSVRPLPFFDDPLVRYQLAVNDLQTLAEGLRHLCRLLLRAGATTLYPVVPGAPVVYSEGDLERLPRKLNAQTPLMTIHLFSSCPMGENRSRCVADSFGRVHGQPGLHLADASLLCTSPSVNPQGAIMALARRNAHHFLGRS